MSLVVKQRVMREWIVRELAHRHRAMTSARKRKALDISRGVFLVFVYFNFNFCYNILASLRWQAAEPSGAKRPNVSLQPSDFRHRTSDIVMPSDIRHPTSSMSYTLHPLLPRWCSVHAPRWCARPWEGSGCHRAFHGDIDGSEPLP